MIVALRKVNPIIRKLIYAYIKAKKAEQKTNDISYQNLEKLDKHIVRRYPITVKLSYSQLSHRQKLINHILKLARKSQSLRWLKNRWNEREYFKYVDLSG